MTKHSGYLFSVFKTVSAFSTTHWIPAPYHIWPYLSISVCPYLPITARTDLPTHIWPSYTSHWPLAANLLRKALMPQTVSTFFLCFQICIFKASIKSHHLNEVLPLRSLPFHSSGRHTAYCDLCHPYLPKLCLRSLLLALYCHRGKSGWFIHC